MDKNSDQTEISRADLLWLESGGLIVDGEEVAPLVFPRKGRRRALTIVVAWLGLAIALPGITLRVHGNMLPTAVVEQLSPDQETRERARAIVNFSPFWFVLLAEAGLATVALLLIRPYAKRVSERSQSLLSIINKEEEV